MTIKFRTESKCESCNSAALKHADFGLLISDALANGRRISAIPYTSVHRALCGKHLNEASISHVYYAETDLPSHHPAR